MTASVTKKTLFSALLITIGIVLGYFENIIFPVVPIYGLKIGFSNLVVLYALYELKTKDSFIIGVFKAILCGVLFSGLVSILYSGIGIVFSIISMHFAKKISWFSPIGVSVIGSAFFQVGQILVACFVLSNTAPFFYFPYLLIGSVFCGIVSGAIILMLRNKLLNLKGYKNE